MFNCLQPNGKSDTPHAVMLRKSASHDAVLFYVPISSPAHTTNCRRTVVSVRYKLKFYKEFLDNVSLRSFQEIYDEPKWKGEEYVFNRRLA